MSLEIMTQTRVDGGVPVERLMCHPRLPYIAGWDSERPAVRIWEHVGGNLRECGVVGGDKPTYPDRAWERIDRIPAAAWHPHEPLLVVAAEGQITQWSADGVSALAAVPAFAGYRCLAFSLDGHALWASPASTGEDDAWESSDVIDLVSGAVSPGPRWDTGVAVHPGGGLLATLRSDQGATYVAFARAGVGVGGPMRQLDRTLILNVDGYEAPVFSADGRHFAIRGNAYEQTLEVFEFPSLERVLGTTLGPPCPGYPYPDEWAEEMEAWSRHNTVFGTRSGMLWVGTPAGTLLEVDVHGEDVVQHDVLAGAPVTSLALTASGEFVVADGGGGLQIVCQPGDRPGEREASQEASRLRVAEFVAATSEIFDGADWEDHAVRTDGERTWHPDDLESVTETGESDPPWLQIRAAVNRAVSARGAS